MNGFSNVDLAIRRLCDCLSGIQDLGLKRFPAGGRNQRAWTAAAAGFRNDSRRSRQGTADRKTDLGMRNCLVEIRSFSVVWLSL